MTRTSRGFTLIELMIVIAIIGILAAIAIPRFSRLLDKSKEATDKGNLGAIRSALSLYYSDCTGVYPTDDLTSLKAGGGHFIQEIPEVVIPANPTNLGHIGRFSGVLTGPIPTGSNDMSDTTSGWLYDNIDGDSYFGHVVVNCTHSDAAGRLWTSF